MNKSGEFDYTNVKPRLVLEFGKHGEGAGEDPRTLYLNEVEASLERVYNLVEEWEAADHVVGAAFAKELRNALQGATPPFPEIVDR
jgi:hypothetical protein